MIARARGLARLLQHRWYRSRPARATVTLPTAFEPGTCEIGLVMTTFNRPAYLRTTLDHLRRSDLRDTVLVLVDDASTDSDTHHQVATCDLGAVPIARIFRHRRRGYAVDEALRDGWDLATESLGCRVLVNLDPDVIVAPDWLTRLRRAHAREQGLVGPHIMTAYNSVTHPTTGPRGDDLVEKASIGGLNMCFDRALYPSLVRSALQYEPIGQVGWDWYVVAAMRAAGYPFFALRPSAIDHIGARGRFSRPDAFDRAVDFA